LIDPDDLAAFRAAVADARPLPASDRVHLGGPMPSPRPLQRLADEQAALRESLHGPITLLDRLEGGDEPSHLAIGVVVSPTACCAICGADAGPCRTRSTCTA